MSSGSVAIIRTFVSTSNVRKLYTILVDIICVVDRFWAGILVGCDTFDGIFCLMSGDTFYVAEKFCGWGIFYVDTCLV